jgi:hypothetical protein
MSPHSQQPGALAIGRRVVHGVGSGGLGGGHAHADLNLVVSVAAFESLRGHR